MRKILALIALITLIIACAPQTPRTQAPAITPAIQPQMTSPESTDAEAETTQDSYNIQIKNFDYTEKVLKIKAGDSVTWTNMDDAPHTATGADFDTGKLAKGQSKTITFDTPGTYTYVCALHPSMKAELVVE